MDAITENDTDLFTTTATKPIYETTEAITTQNTIAENEYNTNAGVNELETNTTIQPIEYYTTEDTVAEGTSTVQIDVAQITTEKAADIDDFTTKITPVNPHIFVMTSYYNNEKSLKS